jgi:hypothetical protein
MYPRAFAQRSTSAKDEALRLWFTRFYSKRRSVADKSRVPVVGAKLHESDWEYLYNCLIKFRYRDEHKRFRRFAGLSHCYDHRDEMADKGDSDAKFHVGKLADIYDRSGVRSWGKLTDATMDYWDLHWSKEQFHEAREEQKHQVHALRELSQMPVLEHYRSGQVRPRDADRTKVVKVMDQHPAYDMSSHHPTRPSSHWDKDDPRGEKRGICEHGKDARGRPRYGTPARPMLYDNAGSRSPPASTASAYGCTQTMLTWVTTLSSGGTRRLRCALAACRADALRVCIRR